MKMIDKAWKVQHKIEDKYKKISDVEFTVVLALVIGLFFYYFYGIYIPSVSEYPFTLLDEYFVYIGTLLPFCLPIGLYFKNLREEIRNGR